MGNPYRLLDLFSGIGGFSLGLERTGRFETVAFCEADGKCRRTLAKAWPGVPIYDDVRDLSAQHLTAAGITVDAICGGFPCQNISLAGRMEGIDGAKSGLWQHYRRLIEETRPAWVIIENSPVLRSRGLEAMLSEFASIGYDAEWHCIPANAVGAPHRRDRLWIVAYPTGQRDGLPPLEISTGWDQSQHRAWWDTEPAVGRVVDGLSAEPHRLAQLGNAVVPAIPYEIGRAILASESLAA
ncbi:DNA cytosine methyltransferase [Sphingomonas sp. DC1100-1]|uniref:DNA cytosine methyltransferase n=1 Tax=unclassified Sphingomonas TaxID=196159 RepID=UPI003CF40F9C